MIIVIPIDVWNILIKSILILNNPGEKIIILSITIAIFNPSN